jgi:GNAT superfamily N-acetyltransferase
MACTSNSESTPTVYRTVEKHEYQQAMNMCYMAFNIHSKVTPGYFERFYTLEPSPRNQADEILGAFHDGKLVSMVHVRPLTFRLRNDNREYMCAYVSGVTTLEEHRKRGYSRHLLQIALDKMEKDGRFDMILLHSLVPNHYSVLGWELMATPGIVTIEWKDFQPTGDNVEWRPAAEVLWSDGQLLQEIY